MTLATRSPVAAVAPATATPIKAKVPKAKGEKTAAGHPSSAQMIIEAITKLADKKGSSLQAIKKMIAGTYLVDIQRQGTNINKALKKLVEDGKLTQPKGKEASGSFKLAVAPKPAKKAAGEKKPKAEKKAASPKKAVAKKAAAKKVASPKKTATAAKPVKEDKSPKEAAPAKKTVAATPAAKKAKAAKPVAEKKAAAPKAPKMKLPKTLKPKVAPKPKTVKKAASKKK